MKFEHIKGSNDLYITVTNTCTSENYTFKSENVGLFLHYGGSTSKVYIIDGDLQRTTYTNYYPVDPFFRLRLNINLNGGLTIKKINSNGDLLSGCTFRIWSEDTGYSNSEITPENGIITLDSLRAGKYHVQEVAPSEGYLKNETIYDVEVKAGEKAETNILTVINSEPTGELQITKEDSEIGNSNRIDGTNQHGDASIKGAIYTLYASNDIYNVARTVKYFSKDEPIATFTFNEKGIATIKIVSNSTTAKLSVSGEKLIGIPLGSFYALETTVPEGYTRDEKIYNYEILYKNSDTKVITVSGIVKNTVQKAKFEVIKVTTNNNTIADYIEGAEFTAILTKYVEFYGSFDEALKHLDQYAEDEYSIFKTSKNGRGISGFMAYGNYTVRETYTPSAGIETVEDFYVTIDRDNKEPIKSLVANDLPFTSYLKLVKQDKQTEKVVTFSSATFNLYKLNEENNNWEKVFCKVGNNYYDSWTTNSQGIAYTENKLESGRYKCSELVIPKGFLQLEEELIFDINNRNETLEYDKDLDAWITVIVQNEQPFGKLVINKEIALKEDVDTSLVDVSDLSKIQFKLVAKEDIIDMADGSVIYLKGEEVGTYNLSEKGKLTIDKLHMGKYEFFENTTLEGLVLEDTRYEFELKAEDTTTKVYTETKKIINHPTVIEISKQDICGEEIEGATLQVSDKNGKIIDEWISTNVPHKIEGLKVGETYILHEKICVDEFVKATDVEFTVSNTKEVQSIKMIDKVIEISKQDISGKEINGATLQIIDENNKVIDEWVSTNIPHRVSGLEENKEYTLHEEISVAGFVKATDLKFTVTTDKETQKVIMIDKIVNVTKTDLTNGEEIEGAELVVTDEEGNVIDEWVSTKEPHSVSNLEENRTYVLTEKTAPYRI